MLDSLRRRYVEGDHVFILHFVSVLGGCRGARHKCECYNTVISSRVCYKCRDPSHQTVTVVVMKSIVEELKLRA